MAEKKLGDGSTITIKGDLAIVALSWETRCTAVERFVVLDVKKILLLDFAHRAEKDPVIEGNRLKLHAVAEAREIDLVELELNVSTSYSENIHALSMALSEFGRELGSYHNSLRRVFVDCSSMPRVYIQWLIAYSFLSGKVHALDFGYAAGDYREPSRTKFENKVESYDSVPLLNGSGGVGEEKLLLVGIGGDADMFYGLFDAFSPERVALLVPRSTDNTQLDALLDEQIAKVTEMYRLEDNDVAELSGFALLEHLNQLREYSQFAGKRAVISLFMGGTKIQAIASALFGCFDKRVQVKFRVPKSYKRGDVCSNGNYYIYRLVDITSPSCSLPDTW
nr:hypothetical protein [uncultured Cohaesibacter sp.]